MRNVTIKDIARIAGVNVSTVSRALAGKSGVSKENSKIIAKIAAELNYTPDFSAQAMVGKGTKLIGVVVPEISSNYYAKIVDCIDLELNNSGYSLIISTTSFQKQREVDSLRMLKGRKVDGIIFCGTPDYDTLQFLSGAKGDLKTPLVFLDPVESPDKFPSVSIDSEYGINLVVECFASRGHKRMGFVGESLSSRVRLPLFKKALIRNGIEYNERSIKSGTERFELGGYLRMKELLREEVSPTAVFAAYDYIAIGAIKTLKEEGVSIPQGMAIAGYDNIREAEFLDIPLTTVDVPIAEMVHEGTKLLNNSIDSGESQVHTNIVLKPRLIERQSTCL